MAAKYDDRTAKGWPLPHRGNRLYDDVERLREALTLIDKSITGVETHEGSIEERQDFLDTRMDVIAGQATEDTEILDARVDAKREVHPNLGHNIRNIHAILVGLVDDFQGLLRQFNALAQAQIQGELNDLEAHERRKKEIQLEALTRLVQDDGLQLQINATATAILQTTQNLLDINERRKADSIYEETIRSTDDGILQTQIDELAVAIHENLLTLCTTLERRKEALEREIQSRIEHDEFLQEQVDTVSYGSLQNAQNIHQEAETRRKKLSEANERIDVLDSENKNRKAEILSEVQERKSQDNELQKTLNETDKELNSEIQARVENDLGLARQSNSNAEAILHTELNLLAANDRRKADTS